MTEDNVKRSGLGLKVGWVGRFALHSERLRSTGQINPGLAVIVLDDGGPLEPIGQIPMPSDAELASAVKRHVADWLRGQEKLISGFRDRPAGVGEPYLQKLIPRRDRVKNAFDELAP